MTFHPLVRSVGLGLALMTSATGAALAQDSATPAANPATAPAAQAADVTAGTYSFDQDHSHIVFGYNHMGFSTSTGLIRGVTGTITLDPANPAQSSVKASFPLSAMLTVSPQLDEHKFSDDLFKGESPSTEVTFASTSVEPTGDTTAKVMGDLTLNGVTKPVTLDVTLMKAGEHPMAKVPAVGFEATTTLKRTDYNLGAFVPAVADEVQVSIHAEAQKG